MGMKSGALAYFNETLYAFRGTILKPNERVYIFEDLKTGKKRLVSEQWWVSIGGEPVKEEDV